jgi:hypothetical protein
MRNVQMALRDPVRHKHFPVSGSASLAEQRARLAAFRELAPEWDSYDAPAPNETALNGAQIVLQFLEERDDDVPHVHVAPSSEGGVLLVFSAAGSKYADIECYNDGEILAILSEPAEDPVIWPLRLEKEYLQAALERIAAFLDD